MSINQKIVNINDKPYVINAFTGRKGFTLLAKVSKFAAPIIGELTNQREKDDEGKELDINLTPVFQSLFYDGTQGFVDLVFELVEDVECEGYKINIDSHFKLNYVGLLELALEVIKLNYDDVFQKLGMKF